MAQKIKCTVDTCHYWESDVCKAESIEVAKNFEAGSDMEAGMIGTNSSESSQTKCVTFKPRNRDM